MPLESWQTDMGGLKLLMPLNLSFFGGGGGGGGFRGGRQRPRRRPQGNTPGNNRDQNRQFQDAVRELAREGIHLDRDQRGALHRAISGQGLGFWDIVDMGRAMFGSN